MDIQDGPLLERCAQNYIKWRGSPPTSMGRATSHAFSANPKDEHQASEMMARSALLNQSAESNGALMRAAPLGIALQMFEDAEIASIAGENVSWLWVHQLCSCMLCMFSVLLCSKYLGRNHATATPMPPE